MDNKVQITTEFGEVDVICQPQTTVQEIISKVFDSLRSHLSTSFIQECFTLHVKSRPNGTYRGAGFLCPKFTFTDLQNLGTLEMQLKVYSDPTLLAPEALEELQKYELKQARRRYMMVMKDNAKMDRDRALLLGAMEIVCVQKEEKFPKDFKYFLENLEKKKTLPSYFPASVTNGGVKMKSLRKEILQSRGRDSVEDCQMKYRELLETTLQYKHELFHCRHEARNTLVTMLLVVSPARVSLRNHPDAQDDKYVNYEYISGIRVKMIQINVNQPAYHVRLEVTTSPDPNITIVFDDRQSADFACHIIDKYARLCTHRYTIQLLPNGCPCFIQSPEGGGGSSLFKYTIERSQVVRESLFGSGQFGDVYRGFYKKDNLPVAVKTCTPGQSKEFEEEFLKEAEIMADLDQVHIIRMIGVVPSSPIYILMELADLGELRSYLSGNRDILDSASLILFCSQICSALYYLASLRIIHRDIACRNILVCSANCVKLSDFGLARRLKPNEEFVICPGGKLPIKWLPPECFKQHKFSLASDVWMFAVCMWEIFSLGDKPFRNFSNEQVKAEIEKNVRPERPALCPPMLYSVWSRCWLNSPADRFTIQEIRMHFNDAKVEAQRGSPRARLASQEIHGSSPSLQTAPKKPNYPKHLAPSQIPWHSSEDFNLNQSLPNLAGAVKPGMVNNAISNNRKPLMPPAHSPYASSGSRTPTTSTQDLQRKINSSNNPNRVEPPKTPTSDIESIKKELLTVIDSINVFNAAILERPPSQFKLFIQKIGNAIIALLGQVRGFYGVIPPHDPLAQAACKLTDDVRELTRSGHVADQIADVPPLLGDFQGRLIADTHLLAVDLKSFYENVHQRLTAAAALGVIASPSASVFSSSSTPSPLLGIQ